MAELGTQTTVRRRLRHRGRLSQIPIYLGKQIRFFIYQSDWKVLPMATIVAALVGLVIRRDFLQTMEGNLKGAFALTCVAIWNGCFNSIQAICRERPIIKREHRSGMHITSYVASHMIYQFFLCLAQTGLSLYVMGLMGVQFPAEGFMTMTMVTDVGITMLLISYAADMMSLFISSVAHSTTGAMTVMPFVLIFQLVFSGGILPLPDWARPLANYTISNYGIKAIASQSGYNEAPMVTAWNTLQKMRDNQIGGSVTLGQILDALSDQDNPFLITHEDMEIIPSLTVGDLAEVWRAADQSLGLEDVEILHSMTLREALTALLQAQELEQLWLWEAVPATAATPAITLGDMLQALLEDPQAQPALDGTVLEALTLGQALDALDLEEAIQGKEEQTVNQPVTLGQMVDFVGNNQALQAMSDREFTFTATLGDILSLFGEDNVKTLIQEKTAAASRVADYDRTIENVLKNWGALILFAMVFAVLSVMSLEFIDRDKR